MKKKISILLILTILIISTNINTVKATETTTQDVVDFSNGIMNGYSKLLRYAGMIIDAGIEVNRQSTAFIKQQLIKLGLLSSGATDEEVEQFFDDNIVVSPHSNSHHNVEYTSDMIIYIKNEEKEIIDTYGFYYVYSFDILQNTSFFPSGDIYNATKNMCTQYQDDYYIFLHLNSGSIVLCPVSSNGLVQNSASNTDVVYGSLYNYRSWNSYNFSDNKWSYNSNLKEFEKIGTWGFANEGEVSKIDNQTYNIGNGVYLVTYNGCHEYKMYRTLNDLKSDSVGQSPYYISDSYNTFQNTSGSYNTTTTDNSVTYGDITNYINSFNQQNGTNPTPQEIKVYITVTNGQGGGSGGESGGGSGGSDESTSIWDFLSRLGEVLGGLIRNLGNMLTSLIDNLVSIINDIVGKLPNVFSGLLEIVFGGLPEEIKALILLGITCMVTVGIIRIFKG